MLLDGVVRGIARFTAAYLGDLVTFSQLWEEHEVDMRKVLGRLYEACASLKKAKMHFGMTNLCPQTLNLTCIHSLTQEVKWPVFNLAIPFTTVVSRLKKMLVCMLCTHQNAHTSSLHELGPTWPHLFH